jgi:DNA modification methylase
MRTAGQGITKTGIGLKPKDLVGIPWRVAFALQADGWYLRSDIIWAKLNPMPESVTDRPTKSHEYIFLLAKAERYYWDQEAVREEHKLESRLRATRGWNGNMQRDYVHGQQSHMADYHGKTVEEAMALPGRTIRTSDWWNNSLDAVIKQQEAWLAHLKAVRDDGGMLMDADGDPLALMVNTSPLSLPHYAAFPTALVEPMIKAGTSQYGCCSAMKTKLKLREEVQVQCGKPWTRVMEREGKPSGRSDDTVYTGRAYTSPQSQVWGSKRNLGGDGTGATTTGWRPGCTCNADIRSAVVLDPFSGAGTTLLVANRLGRDGIGIELNPDYARMSEKRIAEDAGPMFDMVTVETPEQLEIPLCQNHILNE